MCGHQIMEPLAGLVKKRDSPGDLPDFTGWAAMDFGHLMQRATRLKGVVVGYHGGVEPGITPEDVRQHLIALVPGEIEIDVGRVTPLHIQKPLEDELRFD